ncbi:protein phosphatase 2C-like protein (plasmid) [Rhizobium etli 8C-3]|uniref:Serine/threonine protein phosphatase PrpC n=2 Tax=Rhizobium TaxID=379 RepID=A0A4R3R903_9HYPH|nr:MULTISPECIES: protein phosphatase 2C domain-containing protein [Rhizobium]APO79819.1 protein phosphatase 2C-like protein [Rhizobium etli 8C-3]TCU30617.1 serine/threonine protein phosphatase PrpC [Rhizobium azibense]TCU41371.1 serine/threonine protein phosphatase PrpC [Rhizobium azibense]
MAFAIQWYCQHGTRTADNRDHAGVGIRGDSILAIVLDGSTSGPASGLFAREIAQRVVDWFVTTTANITAATITEKLRDIHAALAGDFRNDSASYALFCADATRQAIALHAGDCLLAHRDGNGQISWLMQPHTLANALYAIPHAILAKLDARHALTRSLRSRNFVAPDLTLIDLHDQELLIGTDGFWADLDPAAQSAFADGRFPANEAERDDRGLLSLSRAAGASTEISGTHATASIYVRRA